MTTGALVLALAAGIGGGMKACAKSAGKVAKPVVTHVSDRSTTESKVTGNWIATDAQS